jgi:Ca-activated chloride channel homolog
MRMVYSWYHSFRAYSFLAFALLVATMLGGCGQHEAQVKPAAVDRVAEKKQEDLAVASQENREGYDAIVENRFEQALAAPQSTFSIDVDTASYANVRRILGEGAIPPKGAVRLEELVNYFPYDYPDPIDEHPFSVNTEIAPCPWQSGHQLLRVALKGKSIDWATRKPSNLVFLIDVSGSMNTPNKLPLVKASLRMLVRELSPEDRIAIVVYAGASGLVLDSTPVHDSERILNAIEGLEAGGSTNGASGIQLAYLVAKANRIEGGLNRSESCGESIPECFGIWPRQLARLDDRKTS